jgi:hypothetical protein
VKTFRLVFIRTKVCPGGFDQSFGHVEACWDAVVVVVGLGVIHASDEPWSEMPPSECTTLILSERVE